MPCFSQQVNSVEFSRMDKRILEESLYENKFTVSKTENTWMLYTPSGAKATIFWDKNSIQTSIRDLELVNEIKRIYSKGVVRVTALKMGWKTKVTKENQYQITRRSF